MIFTIMVCIDHQQLNCTASLIVLLEVVMEILGEVDSSVSKS